MQPDQPNNVTNIPELSIGGGLSPLNDGAAETSQQNQKPVKPVKKKLSTHVIILITALAIVIIAIILYASGILYIGFKAPSQRVVIQPQVCGETIINKYNATLTETDMQTMKDDLKDLAAQINKKAGHDNDANCQFILYYANYWVRDYKAALANAKNLQKLRTQGQFFDNNMTPQSNVDSMAQYMQTLLNRPSGN